MLALVVHQSSHSNGRGSRRGAEGLGEGTGAGGLGAGGLGRELGAGTGAGGLGRELEAEGLGPLMSEWGIAHTDLRLS